MELKRLCNEKKQDETYVLKNEWNKFKTLMETPSFLVDAIINEVKCEEILVDNGCQSYASVSDKFIRKHKPDIIDITPRVMEGFLPGVRTTITQAAKFIVDC